MDRRDVIRRGLGIAGGLSVISLSGRLAPADEPVGTDDPATLDDVAADDTATNDPATLDDVAADDTATNDPATLDDVAADDTAALEGETDDPSDDVYEAVAEQLRRTHEKRCQCPVCAGSMPGRG